MISEEMREGENKGSSSSVLSFVVTFSSCCESFWIVPLDVL